MSSEKITSVIAKSPDGTIQINFTIPYALIRKTKDVVTAELAKEVEVSGFRKGQAPVERAREKISENSVIERALGTLLPKAFGNAIAENKLKVAIYPKFELLKAKEGEDWEVRAITCEIAEIDLPDYKKIIEGEGRAKKLWAPGKDKGEEKGPTETEKQQVVIQTLLKNVKVAIPQVLIDEETNARLSSFLARIEKLGLSLENYLSSIGKTGESLREEYRGQAQESIALELILGRIAEKEGIKISEKEVEDALKVSGSAKSDHSRGEEKGRVVENILKRKAVIDSLTALL